MIRFEDKFRILSVHPTGDPTKAERPEKTDVVLLPGEFLMIANKSWFGPTSLLKAMPAADTIERVNGMLDTDSAADKIMKTTRHSTIEVCPC
jgi:hypothetical protein